ncbi:type Z 30S ribosomal protein S14 [Candidatus Peregrinibacteria bacterium]|nr:type Z 30S ribosomal protein S14 [Candidatus Peregrinibacteria bacterium]
MSRKALRVKQSRLEKNALKAIAAGKKIKFPTRVYHRCKLCGRIGGFMRRFEICRICFRELALRGLIPGVKKSSW